MAVGDRSAAIADRAERTGGFARVARCSSDDALPELLVNLRVSGVGGIAIVRDRPAADDAGLERWARGVWESIARHPSAVWLVGDEVPISWPTWHRLMTANVLGSVSVERGLETISRAWLWTWPDIEAPALGFRGLLGPWDWARAGFHGWCGNCLPILRHDGVLEREGQEQAQERLEILLATIRDIFGHPFGNTAGRLERLVSLKPRLLVPEATWRPTEAEYATYGDAGEIAGLVEAARAAGEIPLLYRPLTVPPVDGAGDILLDDGGALMRWSEWQAATRGGLLGVFTPKEFWPAAPGKRTAWAVAATEGLSSVFDRTLEALAKTCAFLEAVDGYDTAQDLKILTHSAAATWLARYLYLGPE